MRLNESLPALSEIRAERSRRSLLTFAAHLYPGFQPAAHLQAAAHELERLARGEIRWLTIEMPPRHGKSLLSSILFPPWLLGNDPDHRIIAASYSADLSYTFSRQARNLMGSPEYHEVFPEIRLADDARAVGQWELAPPHRGGYVSAGVGGSITGKGAHTLIVDDPIKDAAEANSQTQLDRAWEWYSQTAFPRLMKGGRVVIIATRWAESDITGRVLENAKVLGADEWTVVRLPAFAEEHDALGRPVGAPLWPEMFDTVELNRRRLTLGSRAFAAQYQQRPAPAEGSIFKREWWKRYGAFDRSQALQVIQVWDTAFQAKQTADYSVCATWALSHTGAYLLDLYRGRLEFPELKRKARDLFDHWRPGAVLIEDKASGQSLIQELRRETSLPVIAVKVDADKVTRAHAVTPYIEAGRVHLPESAPWVDEFIEEHAAFPMGAHDDQCDTSSMALKRLLGDGDGLPYGWVRQAPQLRAPATEAEQSLSDEERIRLRLQAYYASEPSTD